MNHTPTPWVEAQDDERGIWYILDTQDEGGESTCMIARLMFNDEANAEFIVRAVNSHDLLLEAAEAAAPVINGMVLEMELTDPPEADGAADAFAGELRQLHQLHDLIRTAINAAKGNHQ